MIEERSAIGIICDEHNQIMNEIVEGARVVISERNFENTQFDIGDLCYDHNRVVLSEKTRFEDCINASYIDGFKQPKAYIATNTPDSEVAIRNFWKMVWKEQSEAIVMLNKKEKDSISYWNPKKGESLQWGDLNVKTIKVDCTLWCCHITKLLVTHKNGKRMTVNHFLFTYWQRDEILPSECDFLTLILLINLYKRPVMVPKSLKDSKTPIVVHCSDGLTRSMAFCAVDIAISTIKEKGKVNLRSIVSRLRKERFDCLYDACTYSFYYLALYEYVSSYMKA